MRSGRRAWLRLIAPIVLLLGLALAACGGGDGEIHVIVDGTVVGATPGPGTATALAGSTVRPFTPTPFKSNLDRKDLRGFVMPVEGACLPSRDEVMPNAPRAYRRGVNEGVDFYNGDVCASIKKGTPVRAMYAGVVIRADRDYKELTADQDKALAAKIAAQGSADAETLDVYRGRQVWVDHGNGIVSRYAHLSGLADGIAVGIEVTAGKAVGLVGESGTPESITAPGAEVHLHAEVRIDEAFLGAGLPAREVRRLYVQLFAAAAPPPAATPAPTAVATASPVATPPLPVPTATPVAPPPAATPSPTQTATTAPVPTATPTPPR